MTRSGDYAQLLKALCITREMSHPFWTKLWEEVTRRTIDYYTAYYATEPKVLRNFNQEYGIDYWVIRRRDFIRPSRHFEPFRSWIRKTFRPDEHMLLARVPSAIRLWDDGTKFYLVASKDLLAWLDSEQRPKDLVGEP